MAQHIKTTPQAFREKHARNLKAAVPYMEAGIMAVTEAPTAKAAAKQDKLVQNWNAAVQSGKWKEGLGKVDLQAWQKAAIEKGLGRISSGVDGAAGKIEAFAQKLLNVEEGILVQMEKMPDLTIDDSVRRVEFFMRNMAKSFGRK